MEKNNESLHILRHSASHIMAQAVQDLFPGAKLAIGPATDSGFYYDFDMTDGHAFTGEDLVKIEEKMKEIVKQNLTFEKYTVEDVDKKIAEFKSQGEIYKAELLEEHRNDNPTLYFTKDKDGNVLFNDLCAGPHVPNTSFIKHNAFKLLKVAGAYWRGDEKNKMLQRIYATAFWTKEDLADYLNFLAEAEKRDHRKLGSQLDLFSIREEVGSGLVLWHPNLATVREEIENYWRSEHRKRGYQIVVSPHIAKSHLWDISGHSFHYRENMYFIKDGDDEYVLKPMNCPFHILIYQADRYSYRSLPLRLAELGTVYRNERSGALAGLSRVKGFTQDDAHIFCTPEQLIDEINSIIDFVSDALSMFNMSFEIELSTRPEENYVGILENWNKAEEGLKKALEIKGVKYNINKGDGAFYGPKIDFKLKDAIGRTWQCATIQLDFNLPERFELKYQDKDGQLKTPIMIHRVIFGSMERFMGVLIEHYAGAFPTWLAPTQVCIVPISTEKHLGFCEEVYKKLNNLGIRVKLDERSESMNYKIREALQDKKIPYVAVIGDKEIEANSLAIRARGKGQIGVFAIDDFISMLQKEISAKGKAGN